MEDLKYAGAYRVQCWRTVADNTRYLAWEENAKNKITNEGLNWVNNLVFFTNAKKQGNYLLLVSSNTAEASGMTYAVPTFTESTAYGSTRPAANFAVGTGQQINTNASPANFTITAPETEYGAALVMGSTANCNVAGDTATSGAVLFSYARFANARSVVATDVISLSYAANAASVT